MNPTQTQYFAQLLTAEAQRLGIPHTATPLPTKGNLVRIQLGPITVVYWPRFNAPGVMLAGYLWEARTSHWERWDSEPGERDPVLANQAIALAKTLPRLIATVEERVATTEDPLANAPIDFKNLAFVASLD